MHPLMKYYVESYGCTMNFGEGRRLSADMASMGYSESASAEEADEEASSLTRLPVSVGRRPRGIEGGALAGAAS